MRFIDDDFEEEKGAVRLFSTLKKSIPYLKQEKWSFVLALVFLVFMSIFSLALPLILKNIIDLALPEKNVQLLWVLTAVYLVIFIFYLVLNFCQVFMLTKVGVRIVTKVKTELFEKLLTFDLGFFHRYTVGRLLSRVESDGENIKQLFSLVTVNILQSSLMFLGILGILFYTSPKITGFVSLLVPICFISTYIVLKKLKVLFKKSRRFHANITSVVTELLQFVDVIQIFRYKKGALDKLKAVNRQKFVNDAKAHFGEQGFWGFFMFFEIAAISIVLFVGAGQFIQGTMTIGTLVMFIEFIRRLFYPILQLSQYLNEVQKGVVSAERMFNLMEEKPQVLDPVLVKCQPVLNQSLVFKNVSFSYQLPQLVLQNISFSVKKANSLAIVGPSGSGKSTIVGLCMRFFDPLEGQILFDDVDIKSFSQRELRRQIGFVTQEMYFMSGTIEDNITLNDPKIERERVLWACEVVGLRELIERKPQGLNTVVSEKGNNLSVGEKQLISFARALVRKPALLILDEATSAVDPETERLIQEATKNVLQRQSSIVIAHRLSTIENCNEILFLKNGQITERGTHFDLMQNQGEYSHLFSLQASQLEFL